jgi:hypothetical protein
MKVSSRTRLCFSPRGDDWRSDSRADKTMPRKIGTVDVVANEPLAISRTIWLRRSAFFCSPVTDRLHFKARRTFWTNSASGSAQIISADERRVAAARRVIEVASSASPGRTLGGRA